ncbi:Fur-regulated basic protein FbpA [Metabacillus sediminilitoris]|uniref:Fur-regulated basic protein FbpA n=1 Tax=Metabacillus sediminilitoris TaxID=2567941 RepID=A0A4S4C4L6_9BACI|nr:Fur-regulated basic protein FbpA [Metabacillus sediminilitoris]QGQ47648.1 Fur-regulated basic protein FbpA [Metabacillus sediminilitoris]THF82082.1 Fur-regulated basic protein FbpA [Metabacillus sediminilitoris]
MEYFKAIDDRQLNELTLSQLEKEYRILTAF